MKRRPKDDGLRIVVSRRLVGIYFDGRKKPFVYATTKRKLPAKKVGR